jgi:polygalacturonase
VHKRFHILRTPFAGQTPWPSTTPRVSAQPPLHPTFDRATAPGGAGKWNVGAFGATPDNATDNTASFAKALAACGAAGGGDVSVPVRHPAAGLPVLS